MKTSTRLAAAALALAFMVGSSPARADDEDKAACADKSEGDDCTRGDGDPGTCTQDESDAVLSCDDDASSDDSSGGCSASPSTPTTTGGALAGLVGLGLIAARRRSRAS